MRRLALLALAPLLVSAADPVQVAQREAAAAAAEQQRLEAAAAAARGEAQKAAAQRALEAQAMLAADSRIALAEAQLAALERRRAILDARLAEARRPATALLAGLAEAGRRPAWLMLATAGGAEEQVRLAALVRALGPEVERRSAALRGEAEALAATAKAQQALRQAAAEAQRRFAAREMEALATARTKDAEAFVAGDAVLSEGERAALAADEGAQRQAARSLAVALAKLPAAEPRPIAGEGRAETPPFEWSVPAGGAVTVGMGELASNGVRSRGLTLASGTGTEVAAPGPGKVVFAGPFRARAGVIIIDHGGGWASLLTGVRPSVRVGDGVSRGQGIGRALGPVTAELFRGGRAEPAALIAR